MSKSGPRIGTIRKRKNKLGKEYSYIVFGPDVEITIKGKKVPKSKYGTAALFKADPVAETKFAIEKGWIDEADVEKRLEEAQQLAGKVKYNIHLTPPQD